MLVVEGRQHDPARAPVEVAVDRQQAVAHQADQVAEVSVAPEEVGGVRDEHVVVGLRAEHEHDIAVEQPQREHGAVALVAVEQHRQRLVGEAPGAGEREACLARRVRDGGGALGAQVLDEDDERVVGARGCGGLERHGREQQ